MSYDIFLKIDGIDGESMDDKHKNEIEVLSWRWNIHQESTMHAGSGHQESTMHASGGTITAGYDFKANKEI
ncbi:Putative cytoplasmic protein USSDB7A [Salmonella enterica subsp. enterica serovar Uganda str. R8-3404]|uniref:Cytoplasmic protein USSDB7A n=1 Tax=Salmonella enterica subsp. enterica serovar Uganda str. R8-3404 TaxID=913083 RepID=A0A6C8H6R8_SALET|nr:Putative cytoplasmic protein USSDB7A [Salmonella enterica subsp. enterica serovar Uganda str. R8-3404]